jgi:hypothetical protein
MNKLIENANNNVYCRLQCSKTHGVGVFAIKDIPINTNPFQLAADQCQGIYAIEDEPSFVEKILHPEIKKMVKDFGGLPKKGFNAMTIAWYMNHSDKPNTNIGTSLCGKLVFVTNTNIKAGEELFINYNHYD